jgi:L-lactate permease
VIWNQTYFLFGHGLGLSVILASLPILTLLLLLGVFRKPAWVAGLAGLAVTLLLAILCYRMPVVTAVSAAADGAAFGLLPISWIIFWAIVLFRVTVETGQFEIIKDSIGCLTPDPRLQALLIAFAFGGFLEGAAGFGAPVAIASTMLIGLEFTPFAASAICLLANTAPGAFGSIGIPIVTLAGTTGLPLDKLSAAVGRICTPMSFIIPAYLIIAMGGFSSLSGIWVPTLMAGGTFAIVQLLVSTYLGPQLTDILAAIVTMAVLVLWFRIRRNEPKTFRHQQLHGQNLRAPIQTEPTPATIPSVNNLSATVAAPCFMHGFLMRFSSFACFYGGGCLSRLSSTKQPSSSIGLIWITLCSACRPSFPGPCPTMQFTTSVGSLRQAQPAWPQRFFRHSCSG